MADRQFAEAVGDSVHPLIPPGSTLEVHQPREGRYAKNIGVFLTGVALVIAAAFGVPPLRSWIHAQSAYNREQSCRAKVNAVTTAINAKLIADMTDVLGAAVAKTPISDPVGTLTADRNKQRLLIPLQANVVILCHNDSDYQLPAAVLP